jgi:hypothetical protein
VKVLLFGPTGMVGQGMLRECLLDSGVELVQTMGRAPKKIFESRDISAVARSHALECEVT